MLLKPYLYLCIFYKCFSKFYEKVFGREKNKRWSKSIGKNKSFIAIDISFFCFGLTASKFILLARKFDLMIDAKTLLSIKL